MSISIFKFGSRHGSTIRLAVDRKADAGWQPQINDVFPDFSAHSTKGRIDFSEWADGNWVLLISHPAAFTPVCTTEIRALAERHEEFAERQIKIIALTGDSLERLNDWSDEIEHDSGVTIPFPHISDENQVITKGCGLMSQEMDARGRLCARRSLLIDPRGIVRMIMDYPLAVGRSVDETLRSIDALMLSERVGGLAPSDWKPGEPLLPRRTTSPHAMKLRYGKQETDACSLFGETKARPDESDPAQAPRSGRLPEISNMELRRLVNEHNLQMRADAGAGAGKSSDVFATLRH